MSFIRTVAGAAALTVALAASEARAEENPCGNFDLSAGISCKIEVSGGCTAKCTPFLFETACTGGCTQSASMTCVDNCGVSCVAQCDPSLLDCFEGCHKECDGPVMDECKKTGGTDCSNKAKAQCDIHCKDNCKIKPSSCSEHCTKCCTGGCKSQINFSCDYKCMTKMQGGCEAQCTAPTGAIFCNGQYVGASDVVKCISYLATKGITVDASASLSCDLTGCKAGAKAGIFGCAASGVDPLGTGLGLAGFGATLVAAMIARTVRRRRSTRLPPGRTV
jgi:hypothetical protein